MIDTTKLMTERMSLSTIRKYNSENTKYSYRMSILLESLYKASQLLENEELYNYVSNMLNYYIPEDGVISTYNIEEYSMDQVRMGNLIIEFYKATGQKKFKTALDMFYKQLQGQPRTLSGGFWHKKKHENQMWLDGLYMQAPFYVKYTMEFGGLKECLADVAHQFELVYEKTKDEKTGLLHHGWDESCLSPWCDPKTGRSPEVWSRALGWYVIALADLLEIIPKEYKEYRDRLLKLALALAPVVLRYQDAESGMWWQVMDKPAVGANYLETSATSMFIYFFLKMHRLGFLDSSYKACAKKGFEGMCARELTCDQNGELHLHNTCKTACLGLAKDKEPVRSANFVYYTEYEQRVTDNLHGVAMFIWAAIELEFADKLKEERV